ncbi:MAG: acetyl-CoA C-acyltransferase, partial [Bdellovibrionales bacterium]|nr:acetyl-CoA C-acyltransferase [Bdellovibrionales bacterium]
SRKDLMTAALEGLIQKSNIKNQLLGDVALGAVMNSVSDFNLAREVVLSTSLDPKTPAYNVQRACGTGLENVWQIGMKLHTGSIETGIAGGVDTNSDLPIEVSESLKKTLLELNQARSFSDKMRAFKNLSLHSLKPKVPNVNEPRTLLSMGQHTELMINEWKISREEQDQFAYQSHFNGQRAYEQGFYEDLVINYLGSHRDGILRKDISLEKLRSLKPAFSENGSLTAGNSSPLTDGAAVVLMANKSGADKLGLAPLAKLVDVQVAAVNFVKGEGLLMAPTKAIAQLLIRNKLTFNDFDFFELHEAFAGQVLCNLKALESEKYAKESLGLSFVPGPIPMEKINTVGSSIALGHPFAATGARIIGTLAKLISAKGNGRGLISLCTAGGMGIAGILESV